METKICTKCKIKKPLDKFYTDKGKPLDVSSQCKVCLAIYHKAHAKLYRETHLEERNAYNKAWREAHPEKVKARSRLWREAHKNERNAYIKQRNKDPKVRLNNCMSTAIRRFLKDGKGGIAWTKLVNYDINKLKRHLEGLFQPGMTWGNYGEWHLDHKIPISVFNFTKPEHRDFKKCWALKNLQPLWAGENLKKRDNLIKHFQPSFLF